MNNSTVEISKGKKGLSLTTSNIVYPAHRFCSNIFGWFARVVSFMFSFEVVFCLFLFAGRYKADPRFTWVPVDITGLFFSLSVVAGIYLILIHRVRLKRRALPIACVALGFVVWTIFSLAWTPGELYATQKTFYFATLTFWALLSAAFIIASDIHRIRRFFLTIVLFAIWIMIESIFVYLKNSGIGFINAMGGNYLGIGYTCGMGGLIILTYALFESKSVSKKFLMMILFSLLLYIMLVAGGRGPLLMMVVAALIPVIFAFRFSITKLIKVKRYIFPFLGIIVLAIVLIGYLFIEKHVAMTTIYRVLVLFEPGMGRSGGARMSMWLSSVSLWVDNPLFGSGIGGYPIIMGYGDFRSYPHNIFLEIMVELGLVGLFLFVMLLFVSFRSLGTLRAVRNDPIRLIILMLFTFTTGRALISGDLHSNRLLFMVIGLMAFRNQFVINPAVAKKKNTDLCKISPHPKL